MYWQWPKVNANVNDRIALINLLYEPMLQFNIQIHQKLFDYKINGKSFGNGMRCK